MIELPADLQAFLARQKFGWFGQRALDCIGLDEMLKFETIVCCDHGLDTDLISARTNASVISLERETRLREKWSNFSLEKLFEGETLSHLSAMLSSRNQTLNIVAYCSVEGLEALVADFDSLATVLAPRAFLKRFFDNKITLRAVLPALGIEPVLGRVVRVGAASFKDLQRAYGLPFVVQFAIGASGSHTFIISSESQFESLQSDNPAQNVVVSKYIHGPAPNINALVSDSAVLLSYPSIQLIGVPECTDWPTRYCGNDFSAMRSFPRSIVQAISEKAKRIGNWLRLHGFRGIFGVDFVMDERGVYPVEVNPRFQGSTHVLTQLQLLRGELPLALAHVLEYLKKDGRDLGMQLPPPSVEPEPLHGSQMILHSKEKNQCIVRGFLRPGIYSLEDETVTFLRDGLSILDCQSLDEFAVTCAVPVPGTQVESGAPLLKVQSRRQVLNAGTNSLLPWASNVCKRLYDSLSLAEASSVQVR